MLAGGDGILFDQLAGLGVPFHKLKRLVHPIKPWKDWNAYREIREVLLKINPDLVTTHSNKAGLLGRLAARSLIIPVIHTSHGFLFSDRPTSLAGCFYRLMEKIAAALGSKVIAVSESEFTAAEKLKVIPAGKMAVVYNGLPELNPPSPASPVSEPPCLVMVARFAKPKDHATLLKALGNLKQLPWTIQFVGDGGGQAQAENLTNMLGIAERVRFLGTVADVTPILAGSQILVLSSGREGFPLCILEGMRAGLPVVAAAVGGVGEAVVDGKTGFLFPPGNVEKLQEKLARLISDPQLRVAMGKAGRERFLQYFTLDKMLEKTMAVYRSILD